jgi:hypothetical protein
MAPFAVELSADVSQARVFGNALGAAPPKVQALANPAGWPMFQFAYVTASRQASLWNPQAARLVRRAVRATWPLAGGLCQAESGKAGKAPRDQPHTDETLEAAAQEGAHADPVAPRRLRKRAVLLLAGGSLAREP